jgi:hypothetical protein
MGILEGTCSTSLSFPLFFLGEARSGIFETFRGGPSPLKNFSIHHNILYIEFWKSG